MAYKYLSWLISICPRPCQNRFKYYNPTSDSLIMYGCQSCEVGSLKLNEVLRDVFQEPAMKIRDPIVVWDVTELARNSSLVKGKYQ